MYVSEHVPLLLKSVSAGISIDSVSQNKPLGGREHVDEGRTEEHPFARSYLGLVIASIFTKKYLEDIH